MPDPEPDPDFVTVRRPADAPFRVLPEDLVSEVPAGYDLSLVRDVAQQGLTTPITVTPLGHGRFKVVDGFKRLAAIRILIRSNKLVYDGLQGIKRPARGAFAFVCCRVLRSPKRPNDERSQIPPGS